MTWGGYYGEGKRGGTHSTFLCGLRENSNPPPMRYPYAKSAVNLSIGSTRSLKLAVVLLPEIMRRSGYPVHCKFLNSWRHLTDGRWRDWDLNKPPTEYIELADPKQTMERPDQWIRPDECISLKLRADLGPWLYRSKLHRLHLQVSLQSKI